MKKLLALTARHTSVLLMVCLLLTASTLVMAGNQKDEKEQMALLLKVLQMEEVTKGDVPRCLLDDKAASSYCRDILRLTDEQYRQDTIRANALIRKASWLNDHQVFPDEKTTRRLIKQHYDPKKLGDIYYWADRILRNVHPRYAIMTGFCDKQLQRRREAMRQTMPTGRLVRLTYKEFGSSRPTPVSYVLRHDSITGRWQLNGREVDDNVAAQVRTLAERHHAYQCLTTYDEPPSFPDAPLTLGGPPSWSFYCQFEGGVIQTGSECMPLPEGCAVLVQYLKDIR